MKVFISWSGHRSRAVADLMSVWIKCVLQASEPWISTKHIDRGALWFSEINEKLRDVSVGIVCLTLENKDKPWILFETGALAKGLSGNRICTFLIDLEPGDLTDPLAQFNHTKPDKAGMWELVKTLNSCMNDRVLDDVVLQRAFDVYWPSFEQDFSIAVAANPAVEVKRRPQNDVMMEILDTTRLLSRRIGALENHSGPIRYSPGDLAMAAKATSEAVSMLRDGVSKAQVFDVLVANGVRNSEAKKIIEEVSKSKRDHFPGGDILESDL
ncbi:hypothetical protein [Pseudomonas sp. GXZC]|uniref:hypothetical protein n=1 Tax=Pseudomonas sp. GXZC TaxID=3003351 RepID=UPI0022AADDD4|nr:hypothetical protein [Pseudomonas sp. GXZC]WAT31784.1 hypothetical protein OZ428_16005 [Pseudomonas sp. GXZC]